MTYCYASLISRSSYYSIRFLNSKKMAGLCSSNRMKFSLVILVRSRGYFAADASSRFGSISLEHTLTIAVCFFPVIAAISPKKDPEVRSLIVVYRSGSWYPCLLFFIYLKVFSRLLKFDMSMGEFTVKSSFSGESINLDFFSFLALV